MILGAGTITDPENTSAVTLFMNGSLADVNICGEQQLNCKSNVTEDVRNIFMSGFSESIFRILSSTSKNGCLSETVDQIDRRFNLINQSKVSLFNIYYLPRVVLAHSYCQPP